MKDLGRITLKFTSKPEQLLISHLDSKKDQIVSNYHYIKKKNPINIIFPSIVEVLCFKLCFKW